MFCVIQEIERKKQPRHGYPKELVSSYCQMSFQGEDLSHWNHYYGYEYFERPIRKSYKVMIHHNYRVNGKVMKKQFVLCTLGYYELADDYWGLYDYCDKAIQKAAVELNVLSDDIYDLVESKLQPLRDQIVNEFKQTEEYKTHQEHEGITSLYAYNKTEFNEKYGFDGSSHYFDRCYDVFGVLQDPDYLEKIKRDYQFNKEYEEKSRSYQESNYSNYNDNYSSGSSGYSKIINSNHNPEDKEALKQFYRVLSKKFHPDANRDEDTSKQMKLLNQLKQDWGI